MGLKEETLAALLCEIVKRQAGWGEDFDKLTVHQESNHIELQWRDAGVGEDYVVKAFEMEWPDRTYSMDIEGGCDSCGYGRRLSLTISGTVPPWITT